MSEQTRRAHRAAIGAGAIPRPRAIATTAGGPSYDRDREVPGPKGGHLSNVIDRIASITNDVVSVSETASRIADTHLGSPDQPVGPGIDPPTSNGSVDAILSRLEMLAALVQVLSHHVNRIGQL